MALPFRPLRSSQRAELLNILNTCAQLKLNAVFLQVRPNADALYRSSLEPWSQWLSGPGVNPGYDPLAFAIQEAHRRGIELHAWFNPFRAKANVKHAVGRNHISLTRPDLMKRNGSVLLMNPSASASRDHALKVIMDVVRRYDIDGVHLDDYFYPYPTPGRAWSPASFGDGKSPSQRRGYIDDFVQDMYKSVKSSKPWVRVGISPFGIWRPGVPGGIEAGVDAYEHLGVRRPQVAFPRMGGLPGPPALLALQPGQAELSRIDAMVGRPELQTPGVARHCHGTYHEQRRPGPPRL